MNALTQALASAEPSLFAKLEALYKDIHQQPELSMQEVRTAKIVAEALNALPLHVWQSRQWQAYVVGSASSANLYRTAPHRHPPWISGMPASFDCPLRSIRAL
jgi:metal-dependent amidase/aminoacylase/carboxypeptidase family protein